MTLDPVPRSFVAVDIEGYSGSSRPKRARHTTGQGKKKTREAPVKKWDVDNHTSSRSLTHLAGNLNNKPAARGNHTAQLETGPALNRFPLKPLALGPSRGDRLSRSALRNFLCRLIHCDTA